MRKSSVISLDMTSRQIPLRSSKSWTTKEGRAIWRSKQMGRCALLFYFIPFFLFFFLSTSYIYGGGTGGKRSESADKFNKLYYYDPSMHEHTGLVYPSIHSSVH